MDEGVIEEYEKLYDELKGYKLFRNDEIFGWQWLLTLDEYNNIKSFISEKGIPAKKEITNKTARLLVLYIGEYYKREYSGTKNNPFNILGLEVPDYGILCDRLNIIPYKRHNKAMLYTLYVQGGLPINQIFLKLQNNRTNVLVDCLSRLFDADDSIDKAEGEELFEQLNNVSLKESFNRGTGHSIYEYVNEISKSNPKTWDDSDNNRPGFRDFKENLIAARNETAIRKERKKFKLFYSLWTSVDVDSFKEFILYPQLRFNPEEEGDRHYAISKQRLSKWGINNSPAKFKLKFGGKEVFFTWCHNGDYIAWNLDKWIDLDLILKGDITPERLTDLEGQIEYEADNENAPISISNENVYLPYSGKDYLQFYTNDAPSMSSWSSYKGSQSYSYSGILYDKRRYDIKEGELKSFDISDRIGWTTFEYCLTIYDKYKKKAVTLFNSKGRIFARPTDASLHKKIIDCPYIYSESIIDGMIECKLGDNLSRAFIVRNSNITFNLFRVATGEPINGKPELVKYRLATDSESSDIEWQDYNSNNELEQGLFIFKLSYAGYYAEIICLVLKEKACIEIQNQSDPYMIRFNNFRNVFSLDGLQDNDNNGQFKVREENNNEKFIFQLGEDSNNVNITIYHPKPQIHMLYGGRDIQTAIIAFADEIIINSITDGNLQPFCLSDKEVLYKRLFSALTSTAVDGKRESLTKKIQIKQLDDSLPEDEKLCVKVYTVDLENKVYPDAKFKLLLLKTNKIKDLNCNESILDQAKRIVKENKSPGIVFQSLKGVPFEDNYYAPQYIPINEGRIDNITRKEFRQETLSDYATHKSFAFDSTYEQFEIASEHRLYYAVFDSLLSMCWNPKDKKFVIGNQKWLKEKLLAFLKGYIKYPDRKDDEQSVSNLKRLSKEFLFDWTLISKEIENDNDQSLKDFYQLLIAE